MAIFVSLRGSGERRAIGIALKIKELMMITLLEALEICTSALKARRSHILPLFESYGAVVAQDIIATKPLPPFDNSAMDGYAIKLSDFGSTCVCDGIVLAGDDASSLVLHKGHTYKVMTGAMIPRGTEAIIQLEWVKHSKKNVEIPAISPEGDSIYSVEKGQNIRFLGEEIAQDSMLLHKGQRLNHLDISILASQGIDKVQCFEPLKVGIFASGDEVIEPGKAAKAHQIYNTNAAGLYTLLVSRGFKCHYGGILADSQNALCKNIESFQQYDVVITSGGASVGDADLLKQILKAKGAKFLFDGVNVKPGRHLAAATLGDTLVILLPGNPLAMLLHTHTFVLTLLESLQIGKAVYPKALHLHISQELHLKPYTTHMILGRIEDGTFVVYKNGKIGSSSLVAMWKNNAIALVESLSFRQGDRIKVIPYNADFCAIMDYINR